MEIIMRPVVYILFVLTVVLATEFVFSQPIWKKLAGNPVVASSGEINWAYSASVLYDESSGLYKMWYSASLRSVSYLQVMYATSSDGISWHQDIQHSVLASGSIGDFDYNGISDPCVLFVNGEYKMYYTGQAGNTWQTGLATSRDGIQWTKHPSNPVLGIGSGWEAAGPGSVEVIYRDGVYTMLYSGFDGSKHMIGLAISYDGVHWFRYSGNPVFRPSAGNNWDSFSVLASAHFVYNDQFYLLYLGKPQNGIGLATSPDGISWARVRSTPVMNPGAPGTWESTVLTGSVVLRDDEVQFWYGGHGNTYQIGFANASIDALTLVIPAPKAEPSFRIETGYYPNPSNPATKIWYVLPYQAKVKLTLFSALGEEVATLVDGVESSGYHEVEWFPGSSHSGDYYYSISAGGTNAVKELVLLR